MKPSVEHVTSSQIYLVELHLFLGDLDSLLEGDGEVVLPGVHGLNRISWRTTTNQRENEISK